MIIGWTSGAIDQTDMYGLGTSQNYATVFVATVVLVAVDQRLRRQEDLSEVRLRRQEDLSEVRLRRQEDISSVRLRRMTDD